jgi:hypothetical protein
MRGGARQTMMKSSALTGCVVLPKTGGMRASHPIVAKRKAMLAPRQCKVYVYM